MTTNFLHCHTHGEHSLLDGFTRTSDIPKIAKELGQEAVCLTDHGSLGGALKFWKSCKEHEIKGIFGIEAYVTDDRRIKEKGSPTWHLVLLAQNEKGLHNLFALSKIAWTQGFYKKPRIDHKDLELHNEGLIALSACMASETARLIEDGDIPGARICLARYARIFPGRFFVELQPNNSVNLNSTLAQLATELKIPTTVTVDSHYDHCNSKAQEEMLLTMQQLAGFKASDRDYARLMEHEAKREPTLMARINKLWPNRGLRFDDHDLFIMSRDEVVDRMNRQGFDGNALAESTLEIADMCQQVDFKTGVAYLPKVSRVLDSDEYLSALAFDGLEERGLHKDPVYVQRLEEELAIFKEKKFSDYFLIVWDLIREARARDIYVGPGRGSAAGSLVAYCLKITALDPVKYKLLFFRFISPDRNDYPDIDMDFEHTRRDEMKKYMEEKYGEKLSLSTYSQFKAKGVVASIAKTLGMSEQDVRATTKHFNTLDEYDEAEALKEFRARNPEIGMLARQFEGRISGAGMHAAGVVVADRPMELICPIESRTDPEDKKQRVPVTAFDMNDAAEIGLIKFDFLGLNNLTVIHDAVKLIKERHNQDIDWESLEPNDPLVLEMLNGANTVGVFQMESTAYRNLLLAMGVDNFEDLVASNALVRPGAFNTVAKDYIRRKKGIDKVVYPHESVEEWLNDSYGLAIYQEQVMALSVYLGDFSWGKAEKLRKIIGKKLAPEEFAPYYDGWIEGATQKISEKEAEKLWHDFEKHAGYSFNRSHAVCYSFLGYVTAWFKYYYPIEYLYALIKNEGSAMNKMTYLLEAKRLGIQILPPDVNHSNEDMSVEGNALRFGLSDIKGVGFEAAKEIINKRPWTSWDDWNERITARKCNSKVVASLHAVDALRSVEGAPINSEPERNYMEYLNYPVDLEAVARLGISYSPIEDYDEDEKGFVVVCGVTKSIKRTDRYVRLELEDVTGRLTCFGSMDNDLDTGEVVIALVGEKTMLAYSRVEALGSRIESGNLFPFEKLLTGTLFEPIKKLYAYSIGDFSFEKSLAVPLSIRRITTKTGKRMAFVYFSDGKSVQKVTIFSSAWDKIEKVIREYHPFCVRLRSMPDGGYTLDADGIIDAYDLLRMQQEREGKI
jgi:DNA polymerase III subunit alpha